MALRERTWAVHLLGLMAALCLGCANARKASTVCDGYKKKDWKFDDRWSYAKMEQSF